jgi:hypothetical protein
MVVSFPGIYHNFEYRSLHCTVKIIVMNKFWRQQCNIILSQKKFISSKTTYFINKLQIPEYDSMYSFIKY